uniref:Uncharacterized protein n=1 Tax=Steinernema glaseri TaxID=37863 RepID=A0A1I8A9N7_9BILA
MSPANTSNSGSPQPFDSATPDELATDRTEARVGQHHTLPPTVVPPFLPFIPPTQGTPNYQSPNPLLFMPNFMCNPPSCFPNPNALFWRPF